MRSGPAIASNTFARTRPEWSTSRRVVRGTTATSNRSTTANRVPTSASVQHCTAARSSISMTTGGRHRRSAPLRRAFAPSAPAQSYRGAGHAKRRTPTPSTWLGDR
jgi:hypothetical protein